MEPRGTVPRKDLLAITYGPAEGARPPGSPLRVRSKGSVKGKLIRQTTVESEKRPIPKQESKDSGIVTEMITRPKEVKDARDVPRRAKSSDDFDKVSSARRNGGGGSLKTKKTSSVKVKRSQSVKEKSVRTPEYRDMYDKTSLELLTTKQNGVLDDNESDNEKKTSASTIRGMWRKAFKSLKSSSSEPKLFKKGSLYKKKQNSKEEEDQAPASSGVVDPVYSLLKCAQDLPKSGAVSGSSGGSRSPCVSHPHCSGHPSTDHRYVRYPSGGDSSGNTSKTSSPSSSGSNGKLRPHPSALTAKVSKSTSSKTRRE